MIIRLRFRSALLLLTALLAAEAGTKLPEFADTTSSSGVRFVTQASHTTQKYLIETMGGGVAMFDFDGDGWLDLFFVNGAKLGDPMPQAAAPDKSAPTYWNRLFRNNRNGTFTDVTERAGLRGTGYGMGAAVGDYNNDGAADLYVTGYGRNTLYRNDGDGTFTDVTEQAGLGTVRGWSTSAGFFDYDRDGFLDLAVVRYLEWNFSMNIWCGDRRLNLRAFCHPDVFRPATYLLLHNNGDGTFTDVSDRSGFGKAPGHGLGIAFNDFDRDGWPDIAVANDAAPQQLFRNQHDGTFREQGLSAGVAFDDDGRVFSGMGIAFEDYDNDGAADLVVTTLANQKYALFRNQGRGVYDYMTGQSRLGDISLRHSGWGVSLFDYDNDGWKDLFVAQSHVMDNIDQTEPGILYKEKLLLARNTGGRFTDVSAGSGNPFNEAMAARGSATGDLNNDGFEDVAVNCNECAATIAMNRGGNGNHWLTIDTIGTMSNRDGLGARVHLVSEAGRQQWAYVSRAGGYLGSNDKRVHFGLGAERKVHLVEIEWPSGTVQTLTNIDADRAITVGEPRRDDAERMRATGVRAMRQGKLAAARMELEKAAQLAPDSAETNFELGLLYGQVGEVAGASEAFRKAVRAKPDWADAHYNLGLTLIAEAAAKRDWPDAMAEFQEALRLRPEYAAAHHLLGVGLAERGERDAAISQFREALKDNPGSPVFHLDLGKALEDAGERAAAEQEYRAAVRLNPAYAEGEIALGKLLASEGDRLEESREHLKLALRINPDNAAAQYAFARALQHEGRSSEASIGFRQAEALTKRQQDAVQATRLSNEGLDDARQGRAEKALESLRKAIELRPDAAVPHYNLGLVLADKGDLAGARAQIAEAISLGPWETRFYKMLGRIAEQNGAQSIEYDSTADTADSHSASATALGQRGDWTDAIGEWLRVLALRPDDVNARTNLGVSYAHAGNDEQAELEFRKALQVSADAPAAHFGLAVLNLEHGDKTEALKELHEVLRVQPDYPKAKSLLTTVSK